MARYRLLLLEAPPRAAEGMEGLPPGVDAAAFAALRGRAFTGAVVLGAGDDGAELEAAMVALQRAGLAVCVVDDSTAWIRLADTLRTALGFATVREAGAAGAAKAPAARRDEPGLREARDPRWARAAIVGAALLVPIAGAGVASVLFGDRMYDEVAAAVEAADAPEAAAGGAERRLAAHAGSGRDEAAADGPTPAGRAAGAGPSPPAGGAAGGASVALTESTEHEAPAPEPPPPPRRSARRAVAAVVAALLGLGVAALAGEGVERGDAGARGGVATAAAAGGGGRGGAGRAARGDGGVAVGRGERGTSVGAPRGAGARDRSGRSAPHRPLRRRALRALRLSLADWWVVAASRGPPLHVAAIALPRAGPARDRRGGSERGRRRDGGKHARASLAARATPPPRARGDGRGRRRDDVGRDAGRRRRGGGGRAVGAGGRARRGAARGGDRGTGRGSRGAAAPTDDRGTASATDDAGVAGRVVRAGAGAGAVGRAGMATAREGGVVMRWRWGVVVVALAARVEGQEVADPEVAEVPEAAPAVSAAVGRAVAERFVACAGSEGAALTDDDRALIGDSVAPLGGAVARALGAEAGAGAEAEARGVEAVRAASCDALAQALTTAPGAGGAPTPAWAQGHARTLVDRIGRCLAEERGGAATDEELAALGGLRTSLASTLGALVTSGRCSLDENALASCALSVPALSCEALSARLADDPGALGGGVTPECGRFLRCGGDGDGGAEEADDASVDSMGEPSR